MYQIPGEGPMRTVGGQAIGCGRIRGIFRNPEFCICRGCSKGMAIPGDNLTALGALPQLPLLEGYRSHKLFISNKGF